MSQYLEGLSIGDTIDVKGPTGEPRGPARGCSARQSAVVGSLPQAIPLQHVGLLLHIGDIRPCQAASRRRRGPQTTQQRAGHVHYLGGGRYTLDGDEHGATCISMIAGGTGITPMYQVRMALQRRGVGCSVDGAQQRWRPSCGVAALTRLPHRVSSTSGHQGGAQGRVRLDAAGAAVCQRVARWVGLRIEHAGPWRSHAMEHRRMLVGSLPATARTT